MVVIAGFLSYCRIIMEGVSTIFIATQSEPSCVNQRHSTAMQPVKVGDDSEEEQVYKWKQEEALGLHKPFFFVLYSGTDPPTALKLEWGSK